MDQLEIKYEIPAAKVNEILVAIASTIENMGLQTVSKQVAVPSYDELVRRLS
jgi:hypothetical protein